MLCQVDSHCRPQKCFQPVLKAHEPIVSANMWRSTNPQDQRAITDFVRYMATTLSQERSFVFFHFDGDATWSNRKKSQTFKQFQELIVTKVKRLMGARAIPERIERLFRIVPFYSIEAWLYQNTEVAIQICSRVHRNKHVGKFKRWAQSRHELDEVKHVKRETCLGSNHNQELAETSFPAKTVYEIGKSFAESVRTLQASDALKTALKETRRPSKHV